MSDYEIRIRLAGTDGLPADHVETISAPSGRAARSYAKRRAQELSGRVVEVWNLTAGKEAR